MDGPVVVEAFGEAVVVHVLDGGAGHRGAAGWIAGEINEGVDPVGLILVGLEREDQTRFTIQTFVKDDFLGSSLVGGDDGDSGGLGFHDDLSQGVCGGGEGEEVAGGVERSEF